jgi:hypothetical protein
MGSAFHHPRLPQSNRILPFFRGLLTMFRPDRSFAGAVLASLLAAACTMLPVPCAAQPDADAPNLQVTHDPLPAGWVELPVPPERRTWRAGNYAVLILAREDPQIGRFYVVVEALSETAYGALRGASSKPLEVKDEVDDMFGPRIFRTEGKHGSFLGFPALMTYFVQANFGYPGPDYPKGHVVQTPGARCFTSAEVREWIGLEVKGELVRVRVETTLAKPWMSEDDADAAKAYVPAWLAHTQEVHRNETWHVAESLHFPDAGGSVGSNPTGDIPWKTVVLPGALGVAGLLVLVGLVRALGKRRKP